MTAYNDGVRDAMKELWLYDGVIPDEVSRENMAKAIQDKLSYKRIEIKPVVCM